MSDSRPIPRWFERTVLGGVLALFAVMSCVGITWGLPSRSIDKYLFGDEEPWPGEKIYRLAGAATKLDAASLGRRGADVDVDPLKESPDGPVVLTGTDEDVAKIYLRYRLYTYQPDEMITMMALAGMRPGKLQFDPRLYQYGGLFIYPVGALIGACGAIGLIDVRSDVVYYLDHPDEFGKFYVVARAYSAIWGLIGVVIVFAIARRLGQVLGRSSARVRRDSQGGRVIEGPLPHGRGSDHCGAGVGPLAALLFTLMPVVVTMAHEGKPHLPGAVLMLAAVLFAMRHLSRAAGLSLRDVRKNEGVTGPASSRGLKPAAQGRVMGETHGSRDFWLMCICCGAAFGMVLSSWPIFVLIPLVVLLERHSRAAGFSLREPSAGDDVPEHAISRGLKPAAQGVIKRILAGVAAGLAVYFITNPYILINAFINREVLASNFGNSLAMYEIARIGEGFVRVLELSVEGATLPVVVLGGIALVLALFRPGRTVKRSFAVAASEAHHAHAPRAASFSLREPSSGEAVLEEEASRGLKPAAQVEDHARASLGHGTQAEHAQAAPGHATQTLSLRVMMLPLVVPAAVFFLQFVLIGAGKPAEYGRFGIFPDTALAIGAACLLIRRWTRLRAIVNWVPATFVVLWVALLGTAYLHGFWLDAKGDGSRIKAARHFVRQGRAYVRSAESGLKTPNRIELVLYAEPAPYNCPPLHFASYDIARIPPDRSPWGQIGARPHWLSGVIEPVDFAPPLHWAMAGYGRPFQTFHRHLIGLLDYHRVRFPLPPTPISWANKPFVWFCLYYGRFFGDDSPFVDIFETR